METTSIRQLLKNLCLHSLWEYAVFWKLHRGSWIQLTWEDGYCNNPNVREFIEGVSDNAFLGETMWPFDYEMDVINGISAGCKVEQAMESMRFLQYSLGEGYVGSVASTGRHCWLSADEFNSTLCPEFPEDMRPQFAVGIKTIFLVPVIPYGVVQLGSLHKVDEDSTLVAYIKDMFNTLQRNLGESLPSSLNKCLSSPSPRITSSPLEKRTSTRKGEMLDPIQSYEEGIYLVTLDDAEVAMLEESKYTPDMKFQFAGQNHRLQVQGNSYDHTTHTELSYQPLDSTAISYLQNQFSGQFLNGNSFTKVEPSSPFYSDEELRDAANINLGMDFNSYDDILEQQFVETGEVIDQISSHELLNFQADSELHKALGVPPDKRGNEDESSSPTLIYNTDLFGGIEPFLGEPQGFFMTGEDADNLLDAMISSIYDPRCNLSSSRTNSTTSPTISSCHVAASCQTQSQYRCTTPVENGPGPSNSLQTDIDTGNENDPSKFSLKSTSSLIGEEKKEPRHTQPRKSSTKLSQVGQKRPRQSDAQKQRPRDRQMIQDRVKELRELVPNGGKCSIDALLDQTMKHMLYLRSISNRAESLKQCVYSKSSEKQGASWAVEMDNTNFQVCPIVVKDLEQPGHMLIEMLCEENGLFLEIAQEMRKLDLTILKGVMESCMDKSWAHFIVEASSGFRRLDIFWPLMKLLQRNSSISNII